MSPPLTPEVTIRLHLSYCFSSNPRSFKGLLFSLTKYGFENNLISTQVGFQEWRGKDRRLIELHFWFDLVNVWSGFLDKSDKLIIDRCIRGRFFWVKEDDTFFRDFIERKLRPFNDFICLKEKSDHCRVTLISRAGLEVPSDKFVLIWNKKNQGRVISYIRFISLSLQ